MVDFKKDTWIYVLIAAILALISIFTPSGTAPGDISIWWSAMIGYNADLDPSWVGDGAATIWTLSFTSMAIATLLIFGILSMKGTEFKWDWLIYLLIGIGLIIFPILMMVFDLDTATLGEVDIGFAPIGILIAGILCVAAFAIDKFVGGE
ncbi:MAG: hypothetical protein ACFFBC_06385 [Promethearchaeota archaeon]